MKKVYLSALFFGLSLGTVMAQAIEKPYSFGQASTEYKPAQQMPGEAAPKALGVQILADDFTTSAGWTATTVWDGAPGQTGATYGWNMDATPDSWYFTGGINSTSGGNFAEINNGDPIAGTQNDSVTYRLTTSFGIDIPNLPANTSNTDQVTLQYEQTGALFNDAQLTQVSTDGGVTWTTIRDNRDFHGVLSSTGGSPYPDPELVTINLAPYITGNASNVLIRFEWTTAYPTFSNNPNVWITYGWLIDDVEIWTNPDHDLEAQDAYWGTWYLNYYQIPLTQTAPIDFTTNAFNNGIQTQTNAVLNVDITGAETFSGTSQLANIAPGNYDSLILQTPFTPGTIGTYNVTWGITQDQVDDVPGNNDNPNITFDVTQYIYARDDNNVSGITGNSGEEYQAGNFFDAWNTENVFNIDVMLDNTSEIGATLYGKIYWIDTTQSGGLENLIVQIGQTNYHQITAQDLNGVLTMPLLAPTQLDAGSTYLVVIGSDGDGGATDDVVIKDAGVSDPQTSFFYDGTNTTWYYTTGTPTVRLNFQDFTGLEENDALTGLNAYPNPTSNDVTVSYALNNASEVAIHIVDISGKVIESTDLGVQTAGAHMFDINSSNLSSGVYYVTVEHAAGSNTVKFVKK